MGEESEEEQKKGFRVVDKRHRATDEAESADDAESAEPTEAPKEKVLGGEAGVHVGSAEQSKLPPIDFGNFVLSLAHGALVAMGLVEHPELGASEVDIESARQSIEIIEMLKVKTEGNLDTEEEKLITSLLYELRMSFVNASAQKVDSGN